MKQLLVILSVLLLAACAHPALRQAEELGRGNQWPAALRVLDDALAQHPTDPALGAAPVRARAHATPPRNQQIAARGGARRRGRAPALLAQLARADERHPRLAALTVDIERSRRHVVLAREAHKQPEHAESFLPRHQVSTSPCGERYAPTRPHEKYEPALPVRAHSVRC